MSTSFGQWYEEKKAQESGDSSSSSWLPASASDVLPLFDNAELPTFSGMKASLEAQLPQKVMGMDYQQRFQVSSCPLLFVLSNTQNDQQHVNVVVACVCMCVCLLACMVFC